MEMYLQLVPHKDSLVEQVLQQEVGVLGSLVAVAVQLSKVSMLVAQILQVILVQVAQVQQHVLQRVQLLMLVEVAVELTLAALLL
jgi:hypothetical protein|tara:strand:- start:150 stop:404 length:255 start_codon:yes stop_codon:yes gene_type:complete